jgi:hypothetical protein
MLPAQRATAVRWDYDGGSVCRPFDTTSHEFLCTLVTAACEGDEPANTYLLAVQSSLV